ncbi:MAG: PilZ domain-containing protein [Bdellovibrionales bacterium]|nr:PilZ domain-containing protein [Bdellovibrionales bacterium]
MMNRRKLLCFFESSYLEETFKDISNELHMPVMFKKQWSELHPILLSKQVDTLIIECMQPNETLITYLKQTLDKNLVRKVLFLTYHDVYQSLIKNRLLLEVPRNWYNVMLPELTDNLKTLLIKTSAAINVPGQKFPRYEANFPIEISSLSSSQNMGAKMINLSYGGVQCTCPTNTEFKAGEYIRLNVKLTDLNKSHTLNAKIVWIEDKAQAPKKMGLAFVSQQDMYSEMLNAI